MKVKVEGVTYDYDASRLLISEAMEVKQRVGMNLTTWQQGLADLDPAAVKMLVFLLKRRAGEQPDWETLDFDLGGMEMLDDEPEVETGPKGVAPAA